MKHKKLIIILTIIILFLVVGVFVVLKFKNKKRDMPFDMQNLKQEMNIDFERNNTKLDDNSKSKENTNSKQTTTLKSDCEIESASVEKIEPHATYYLEEIYVEENDYIEKDAPILKYTNGTYLTAPYNCIITEISLPENEEKILNSHYVEIESTNILNVSMNISETQISNVNIGDEVEITVSSIDKTYTGYVTNIASTASNKKFSITIEFENDGNIKLGMTATCKIDI